MFKTFNGPKGLCGILYYQQSTQAKTLTKTNVIYKYIEYFVIIQQRVFKVISYIRRQFICGLNIC